MRKGLLLSVACMLAGASFASAQQLAAPTPQATLPYIPTTNAAAPDLAATSPIAGQVPACCSPDRPLGFWVNAEYMLMWIRGGPTSTPLVTTGSLADLPPGALGQPGTKVLFGDSAMGYGTLSGVRLGAGIAITDCLGIEGNYFLLEKGVDHFNAGSNAAGSPLITRPFFNTQVGLQDALGTADPSTTVGPWAGATHISSYSQLQGWELNLAAKRQISDNLTFVALGGFRSLNLNEDLNMQDNFAPLVPGVLTFLGNPISPPSTLADFDRFHTSNTFYGGQLGGRLEWQNGNLSVGLLGKVALGVNQEIATINGTSTLTTPGVGSTTVPGGVYALPTNIGHYYHSAFSVVPEAGLTVGWNITPRIKATVSYTFTYWTQVARPGNQIDPNLNPGIIPTSQVFGTTGGGTHPTFTGFHESDFWAQGLTFGLEFKF